MENNHLKIGKFDAVGLAKKFGTPLYVYQGGSIEDNFKKISAAIPYESKQIHYAIMCNDRQEILKILLNLGSYIQVNSLKEYKVACKAGFPNEKISIATTNMSESDMSEFAKLGAMINFDSIEEIERYGRIAAGLGLKEKKIGIRVFVHQELNGQCTTNSPYFLKERVGIKQGQFGELRNTAKRFGLKIIGVHGYLASNMLDLKPFLKLNKFLFECAKKFSDIEYINFGAGFGIALKPGEHEFNWKLYGEKITSLMLQASKYFGRRINLKIEPGRALVADAGVMLTEVTNIKNIGSWKQVGVDSGFGVFSRPYIYGWNDAGYHPVVCATKADQEPTEIYTICGNSVLQRDYLAEDRCLPKLDTGDMLAFMKTGAYGAVMASGFPGKELAKEIFISKDNQIIEL